MTWTEWAPRRAVWGLQTGLAAWRPAGRAHGGRVSDPAGDGLRDAGRLVTDRRIVGRTGTVVDLRPTWIVAPHVCRSRVDHWADGRRGSGTLRLGWRQSLRRARAAVLGVRVGASCFLAVIARLGFPATLLSRPVLVGYMT